jgi:hypothetical protein
VKYVILIYSRGPRRTSYPATLGELTGCLVIDCDSLDRATAIAARLPDADCHAVEIWPVMELSGTEM